MWHICTIKCTVGKVYVCLFAEINKLEKGFVQPGDHHITSSVNAKDNKYCRRQDLLVTPPAIDDIFPPNMLW